MTAARAGLDRTLAALADPQRRRVVDLLSRGPHRAGEIAKSLDLTPPALSRHLRQLRRIGLIEETHTELDARVRIYSLNAKPLNEVKAWLEETEHLWAEQLSAFKAHVERTRSHGSS